MVELTVIDSFWVVEPCLMVSWWEPAVTDGKLATPVASETAVIPARVTWSPAWGLP